MFNRKKFSAVGQQQAFNQELLLEDEAQRQTEEIKATMQRIYAFLGRYLIDEESAVLEHLNLVNSLKNFENDMVTEAKTRKVGDWRDPAKTVNQLENTVYKVFDPANDLTCRKKAVDDFQVHARNAKFTTETKKKMLLVGCLLGMAVTLVPIVLAPPLGVAIACMAVSTLGLIAAFAFLTHTLATRKNQDANRGLAVSNSLNALRGKRTLIYGAFFNRPKEAGQTNEVAANAAPAFKAG